MQLEWANKVYLYTNKPVLILAPLAVCEQTKKEAYERLGLEVMVCESQDEDKPLIVKTAKNFQSLGYGVCATRGTAAIWQSRALRCKW